MIHPTAIIGSKARIGEHVSVGPGAVIEDGVEVGDNSRIAAYAVLKRGTILGCEVIVDSFAVVGGEPQDLKFDPTTPSGVRVGDRSVLREGVTLHRATVEGGFTEIGEDALLMGYAHVGHDCRVGSRAILANNVLLAGFVEIGAHCFISGAAAFHQFVRVGESAMVGGNASIAYDVPPFSLAAERNTIFGLNLVGLNRRGFSVEELRDLKRCYRAVMMQPGNPRKHAETAQQEKRAQTERGRLFIDFFLRKGKRDFCRSRSQKKDSA